MSEENKTTELTDEAIEKVTGGVNSEDLQVNVQLELDCALYVCKCSTEGNVTVYGVRSDNSGKTIYGQCICTVCNSYAAMITKYPDGSINMFRLG